MKGDLEYRGYIISRFGGDFIAKPADQEEFSPEIVARSLGGLIVHVDEMWNALDMKPKKRPAWIRAWIKNPRLHCLYPDDMIEASRKRVRNVKFFIASLLMGGFIASGASAIDQNGDGRVTDFDLHSFVRNVVNIPRGKNDFRRTVKMDGQLFEFHLEPSDSPHVDFAVLGVKVIN